MRARTPTSYDWIYLADDEWGSDFMQEVAREWFEKHPDCNFVEVHEHGGWWLVFHRSLLVVGTANDRAILPKDLPVMTHFSGFECRRQVKPKITIVGSLLIQPNEKELVEA